MTFFVVLAIATIAAWALPARLGGRSPKEAARRGMAIALMVAGVMHFLRPESFLAYFPGWVPAPELLNAASGIFEIAGGLALLVAGGRHRRLVGVALAAYLVLVLPANVYVAVAGVAVPGLPTAWWYPWLRLPFQALFVWWVLWGTAPAGAPSRRPPRAVASRHPA